MKYVKKANKVLTVADEQLSQYLKEGYDELDEKGNVVNESPLKTYTSQEVKKLTASYDEKIAALNAEVAKLKTKKNEKKADEDKKAEETETPKE